MTKIVLLMVLCSGLANNDCKIIVPDVSVSRAKALDILINEKARKLNGKVK